MRTDAGAWLIRCSFCDWQDLRDARTSGVPSQRPAAVRDLARVPDASPGTGPPATGAQAPDDPALAPSHRVLFYRRDEELLDVLEEYLLAGWASGAVALVIATPGHRAALRERLSAHGQDGVLRDGRLVELDARTTLDGFLRDGSPDPEAFDRTVGALVREHAAGSSLCGFGEMVDLLWADGNSLGALALERLWTGLGDAVTFSLLCAYGTAHVDPAEHDALVGAHDHGEQRSG